MEIIRTTCWFFITISATVAPSGLPVGVTDESTVNNKQQTQRTSNDGGVGVGNVVNQQLLETFNSRNINSLDNIDPNFPRFSDPVPNITVSIGKDALLTCAVENLKGYKVAWVRVDTQTILSIHHNVITQNPRISLSYNDHKSWYLHIKEVEETDRGWYMCQINTDPMRSLKGYLQVVVPPAIIDSQTSSDMVVREGTNVTLTCKAGGYPEPYVMWRREDGGEMAVGGEHVNVVDGEILVISKVSRLHMAAYLCVASNGVPPSVSKRVMLRVQFPPMLSIPNQLEAAYLGQDVTLECHTEAYPTSINYWTTGRGDMIISGDKYETHSTTEDYSKFMRLTIHKVGPGDFGIFRCMAKNSLGETHGLITLDEIPAPFVEHTTEAFYLNQVKGKRPPKKSMSNTIDDYGVEEWKDDYSADYTSPSRGSTHNVRLPPGAFHKNSATLSTICVFQQIFLQISLLVLLCIYSLSIQDMAIRHRLGIINDRI